MESWLEQIPAQIEIAHWILFGMLLLAGLNVPFSEDVIVITAGALAATISPINPKLFYLIIFIGCWVSAWEVYWIGRLVGPKLYEIRWFNWLLTPERIERLHQIYNKYGVFTFIIGRFVPGGFRNLLFMSSGLGKMPFPLFLMRDTPAALISSGTLFSVGMYVGANLEEFIVKFKSYSFWVGLGLVAIALATVVIYAYKKRGV